MTKAMQIVLEAARKLTIEEREELAELLLDTIEAGPEMDLAWYQEAERQVEAHQRSGEAALDAFEAVEDARAHLRAET